MPQLVCLVVGGVYAVVAVSEPRHATGCKYVACRAHEPCVPYNIAAYCGGWIMGACNNKKAVGLMQPHRFGKNEMSVCVISLSLWS